MASLKLLLAVSLCLAASARAQTLDPTKYTCPTGWIPFVQSYSSLAVTCAPDPCYGACGSGTCVNSVQGISGFNFAVNTCTCKPPAVLSHVVYRDYCYVQGTDVCNPSPCKNGATCAAEKDFNGQLGAYTCTCPTNFYGRNCDIKGPPPTPTPKGMPAQGGSDPYTTF